MNTIPLSFNRHPFFMYFISLAVLSVQHFDVTLINSHFLKFQVRSTEMSLHPSDTGLLWTTIDADVKLTPDLFPGGRLRLSCVATVYAVYRKFAYLDFFTPETDPRPERSNDVFRPFE